MTKKSRWFALRLVAGLLVLALAGACSALLDTDELKSGKPPADTGVKDSAPPIEAAPDITPPDLGRCVSGTSCLAPGKYGACAQGTVTCFDGSKDGVCTPKAPAKELCDGVDGDCDNKPDESDGDADIACAPPTAATKYCKKGTPYACAAGCYNSTGCTNGNTCYKPKCACGSATGPTCTGAYQCDAGVCKCGGKVCTTSQTCVNGVCVSKVDAGPDKSVPDQTITDQTPLDLQADKTVQPDKPLDQAIDQPQQLDQ